MSEIGDSWFLQIPQGAQRVLWLPQQHLDDLEFLAGLAPHEANGHGTGLIRPPRGIIAPSALLVPRIRAQKEVGVPDQADNSMFAEGTYDQGQTPECSANSACGILSALKRKQHGPGSWWPFNTHDLFVRGGGTANGGVMQAMDTVLDQTGAKRLADGVLFKEMSWATVPNVLGVWEDTICAAIAAGGFVHQATLVWQGFGSATNGALTSGYHAVFLTAYRNKSSGLQFRFKNSWGDSFAQSGFAWADATVFTGANFQGSYAYSLTVTDATDSGTNPIPTPAPGSFVQQILDLTNQVRTTAGVGPLKLQSQLMASAQAYAILLNSGIPFSHTGPDGSTPFSRMSAAGYTGNVMGENIARGFPDAATVFAAYMNSPGHKANILFASYTQIGIGVSGSSDVMDFGAGGVDDGGPPPPPPPVTTVSIATVSPQPITPGAMVTITGSGFSTSGHLTVGGVSIPVVQNWSDQRIQFGVDVTLSAGSKLLVVTTSDGRQGQALVTVAGGTPPPPVNRSIAVSANSSSVSGLPNWSMASGTLVTVNAREPGQNTVSGQVTVGGGPVPPVPVPPVPGVPTISGTAPDPVAPNGLLSINGAGFGTTPGRVVFFPGSVGRVAVWLNTLVEVFVPADAGVGANQIELDTASGQKVDTIIQVS